MEGLIEIENPNRVAQKSKKVTQIELDEPKQLSRRERYVFCVCDIKLQEIPVKNVQ